MMHADPQAWAALMRWCADISGAFLTSKSFTKMIDWLGITPEVLEGWWTQRLLASQRPDLLPKRPAK